MTSIMTSMKKTIRFAAVGLIVALAAPAYADTVSNKLATNLITTNMIATNMIATNGIPLDGLVVAAPAGKGAVTDIVGIELQDGTSFAR
jgi:hypothetical protein